MSFMDYYLIGVQYASVIMFWIIMVYISMTYIIPDIKKLFKQRKE
jgi:type II secretory pathway component PulF